MESKLQKLEKHMPKREDYTPICEARIGQLLNEVVRKYEAEYPNAQMRANLLRHVAASIRADDLPALKRMLSLIEDAASE